MSQSVEVYGAVTVYKHPSATLDYQLNWSNWLAGDTISSSTWVVPTGLTKVLDTNETTTCTIWLSGGTDKANYKVVNTITTATGKVESKAITVSVTTVGA